mgnify:CR=1 FL=1
MLMNKNRPFFFSNSFFLKIIIIIFPGGFVVIVVVIPLRCLSISGFFFFKLGDGYMSHAHTHTHTHVIYLLID